MFRVRDIKNKKWVDNVILSPNGELYKVKKFLFMNKLVPVSYDEYVYHNCTYLYDKNGTLIYEGDYIEAEISENEEDEISENETVIGIVYFATELSSYVILSFDSEKYYFIGEYVSDKIRVIGNVFEKPKED